METETRHGIAAVAGGSEGPWLVLLHGLGATAGVWSRLLDTPRWPGRWLAPDLSGHGGSEPAARYEVAAQAGMLAAAISEWTGGEPVTLLGHSLGGVLALELASGRHGVDVARVFALGVKVDWSDEEIGRTADLAARPPRCFATRAEALTLFRRLSGLADDGDDDSPLFARGVIAAGDGWRPAMDNRAFFIGRFDFGALVAGARCPVHLACGEHDRMISVERLRDFDPDARALAGAPHNAMVDDPKAVWDWVTAASRTA